jgi:hypothetical protein
MIPATKQQAGGGGDTMRERVRLLEGQLGNLQKKQKVSEAVIERLTRENAKLKETVAKLMEMDTRKLDEHESIALAALDRGDFEVAIRLFARAGKNYAAMLKFYHDTDVQKGEVAMRDALQQHLEAVALDQTL